MQGQGLAQRYEIGFGSGFGTGMSETKHLRFQELWPGDATEQPPLGVEAVPVHQRQQRTCGSGSSGRRPQQQQAVLLICRACRHCVCHLYQCSGGRTNQASPATNDRSASNYEGNKSTHRQVDQQRQQKSEQVVSWMLHSSMFTFLQLPGCR